MGVLETVTRIAQLGGEPAFGAQVAEMRARFEARTGAFAPDDPSSSSCSSCFEERSRAFWCDAVTTGRFGRIVEDRLSPADRDWLVPLERAHRGLFRVAMAASVAAPGAVSARPGRRRLVDAWSGAELVVTLLEDASLAELDAATGQLFDARVVASEDGRTVALLPGAIFHTRDATAPIAPVLAAARARGLGTQETLDALLRMERTLRSLSRVKTAYAYRAEALSPHESAPPREPRDPKQRMRRTAKAPT